MNKYILHSPNNVVMLQEFLDNDFIFINNISETFIKNKLNKNFDCILFLDGAQECEYYRLKALYDNVIGICRLSKCTQLLYLKKFNINYPDSFFSNNNIFTTNTITNILKEYTDTTKFIIKIDNGARGLGQLLADKKNIIKLANTYTSELTVLRDIYNPQSDEQRQINYEIQKYTEEPLPVVDSLKNENTPTDAVKKTIALKFKDIKFSHNEFHEMLYSALNKHGGNKEIIIQKYIPNRQEYRILWFYKYKPLIIKRDIGKDNWQANANGNADNKSYVVAENTMPKFKSILKQIDNLCLHLKVPFLSLDVYYDEDTKKYGIFEFQMEFGWNNAQNLDSSVLSYLIINSTKTLVKDTIKQYE